MGTLPQSPVNLIASAIALYNEVEKGSPYRKFACWTMFHLLSIQEQYLLKNIAKTGVTPTPTASASAKQMLSVVNKTVNRLKGLELITDITTDTDKRPRYALTEFGKDVVATVKMDAERHIDWYLDDKQHPVELGG